ncbi:MAG TPA: alanine racemase [Chthoniobacterales bacterium]|nr:alanine racemase [Chthoniobacterales bacterium]
MKVPDSYRCWAEIDLAALRHNARIARERVGVGVALLAVVKANAYGHGLAEVADALRDEAQLFGVANLLEATAARQAVPHPIIILGPALPAERAEILAREFIPSISSYAEAREFSLLALNSSIAINCAVDTGMGRMGLAEPEAMTEIARIATLPNLTIHSVSTHLPVADEDPAYTRGQLERFSSLMTRVRGEAPGSYLAHALPSAGVAGFPNSAYEIVRAGLMLYGAAPDPTFQRLLHPVMTLKTRVAFLRHLPAGSSVSYGRTFTAPHALRAATLSAGYADGLPRSISNREAAVLIRGRRCPVLGRVTMDLTVVDVSSVPNVTVGDEAVLIGRQGEEEILATEVATRASTIAWEVFTGIGNRVPRVYG